MADQCSTCKYYIDGACHCEAPGWPIQLDIVGASFLRWTPVADTDWCGSFAVSTGRGVDDNCGYCTFYEPVNSVCRREPPRLGWARVYGSQPPWSPVVTSDWCGEFTRGVHAYVPASLGVLDDIDAINMTFGVSVSEMIAMRGSVTETVTFAADSLAEGISGIDSIANTVAFSEDSISEGAAALDITDGSTV